MSKAGQIAWPDARCSGPGHRGKWAALSIVGCDAPSDFAIILTHAGPRTSRVLAGRLSCIALSVDVKAEETVTKRRKSGNNGA